MPDAQAAPMERIAEIATRQGSLTRGEMRALRLYLGASMFDLAAWTGELESCIDAWERGEATPPILTENLLRRLAVLHRA